VAEAGMHSHAGAWEREKGIEGVVGMKFQCEEIGTHVEKIKKWNPSQCKTDDDFTYIDLSSVDKESKKIDLLQTQIVSCSNAPSRARQVVKNADVLIATVRPNLNGVARVPPELNNATASTGYCVLRANIQTLNPEYLFYWVQTVPFVSDMMEKATGASYPAVSDKIIKQSKIPLPPLAEQQKIAAILDAADSLRQKDQQLIDHYTTLSQSLFLEMFGDPVTNPMGWGEISLEMISEISSGVTKGRKLKTDEVFDIPYMRVANVQAGYLNLGEVKTISGTTTDIIKFGLRKGDVLLTEGGDPDKLGRGTVWNDEIKDCIHQNHIFKVRLTCKKSTPIYLSWLCGSEYGKRYFLKSGKQTTGIASINKTQLRRFPVLRPPIALQNQFAERIQAIEAQKQQAQASLEKSNDLFNSLLQKAFKGELTR